MEYELSTKSSEKLIWRIKSTDFYIFHNIYVPYTEAPYIYYHTGLSPKLWDMCWYPHFTNQETEAEKLSNLKSVYELSSPGLNVNLDVLHFHNQTLNSHIILHFYTTRGVGE